MIQQFVLTDQLLTVNALKESSRQELLHRLIEAARIKSTDVGAEAIILQNIVTQQSRMGGIINANSDTHRMKIDVYADAIKLCEEDKNAVVIPTPYNEMGSRNARKTKDTLFSLTINMERDMPERFAAKLQPLDPVVSLSQGFHGVKPGMTVAEVTEIWGAPGAKFQLQPEGYTALAFGKRYWITFYQDKIVSVETEHPLLSADISHQLPEGSIFTELHWAFDGTFGLRAPFKNIKAQHPELSLIEGNLFSLKNPLHEIQLEFNNYQDLHSGSSELFLNKLKLKSANCMALQQPS